MFTSVPIFGFINPFKSINFFNIVKGVDFNQMSMSQFKRYQVTKNLTHLSMLSSSPVKNFSPFKN